MKLTLFVLLGTVSFAVAAPMWAQTPAVSPFKPTRDARAVAIFERAVGVYRGRPVALKVKIEGWPEVNSSDYEIGWRPPNRAFLFSLSQKKTPQLIGLADGQTLKRAFLFERASDRKTIKTPRDLAAIFGVNSILYLALAPLLGGGGLGDLPANATISRGRIPLPEDADEEEISSARQLQNRSDVVKIEADWPYLFPQGRVTLTYVFERKTGRLARFFLARKLDLDSGRRQLETLSLENLRRNAAWPSPQSVAQFEENFYPVPFRGKVPGPERPVGKAFHLDPRAVAFLDRVAAKYGGARTFQLEVAETQNYEIAPSGERASLFYARPNRVALWEKSGAEFVSDGRQFRWKSQTVGEQTGALSDPAHTIAQRLPFWAQPVGNFLADWTRGRHFLRPQRLPVFLEGMSSFSAYYSPPQVAPLGSKVMGEQSVEGVSIRAWYGRPRQSDGVFLLENKLWFKAGTHELLRVQSRAVGKESRREISFNVVSQIFDAPIPASKFVVAGK